MYTNMTGHQQPSTSQYPFEENKPTSSSEPRLQRIIAAISNNVGQAETSIADLTNKIHSIHRMPETSVEPIPQKQELNDALSEMENQLNRVFEVFRKLNILNKHLSEIV